MPAIWVHCRTLFRVLLLIVAAVTGSAEPSTSERKFVSLRIIVGLNLGEKDGLSTLTLVLRPLDRRADDLRITFNPGSGLEVRIAPGRYQVSTERAVNWGSRWAMWDIEVPVTDPVNELHLGEQNAITFTQEPEQEANAKRVSKTKVSKLRASNPARLAQTKNSAIDYIPPPVALSSPATPLEAAIVKVLEKWIRAVEQRDLDLLMSCYAPTLSRYFLHKNVSWEDVKLDKQRFFQKFSKIRKLEIRDLRISPTLQGTEARLTKSWDFGGDINFSGEVVSQLVFQSYDGQWLISAEREREIWVRRVVDQSTAANE
jgi:hypothetical protein